MESSDNERSNWEYSLNEIYEKAEKFLTFPINLVDVGCHKGHFLKSFDIPVKFSIGIDPCHYEDLKYDYKITKAVDIKNGMTILNEFVEPGCNSLLKMKKDIIVHDRSKDGWYVNWEIETRTREREIETERLDSIIDLYPQVLPIHYLKIDSQGNDINVVRSLGKYIEDVWFIQMECVSSHNKEITLYEGQQLMEDDIRDMKEMGFEVLEIVDYSKDASPEADILFYNTKIISLPSE